MGRTISLRPTLSRIVPVATACMLLLLGLNVYDIAQNLLGIAQGDPSDDLLIAQARAVPQGVSGQASAKASAGGGAEAPSDGAPTVKPAGFVGNRCDGDKACAGQPGAAPMSADQSALIKDIQAQAQKVNQETRELAERKQLLEAAAIALDRKLSSLTVDSSSGGTKRTASLSDDDMGRLTAIYGAMKPADAAAIFDILDLHVCVMLLQHMTPRRASAIMEAMSPQRAILATQMLAGRQPTLIPVTHNGG